MISTDEFVQRLDDAITGKQAYDTEQRMRVKELKALAALTDVNVAEYSSTNELHVITADGRQLSGPVEEVLDALVVPRLWGQYAVPQEIEDVPEPAADDDEDDDAPFSLLDLLGGAAGVPLVFRLV